MRRYYLLINLLFSAVSVFASGKTEVPQEYTDIGQLDMTKNRLSDTIFLPYIKPSGIDKIITSNVQGLIIDKIIVDGRIIHPKRILFDMGAYEATSYRNEQDINNEEGQFLMPMDWRAYGSSNRRTYDEALSEGIYFDYYSRNGRIKYSPDKYHIPYGGKEVFIFYRIRFPDYSKEDIFVNYTVSELYTAKFTILWPELRLADRNGRIAPPEDFTFLGVYEFNSDKELVVDLPIVWPSIERFNPYIDKNRWLIMYQLIGDGVLLREERLSGTEKNKIDTLITSAEVEDKKIVKMIWRKNADGIVFYNTENQDAKYTIPYGCKEVYMIYDILFKESVGYSNHNKRLCVKWEIKWN
jgi:hypothetical protein